MEKRTYAGVGILALLILGCGGAGSLVGITEDYVMLVRGSDELMRRGDTSGTLATIFDSGAGSVSHVRFSPDESRVVYEDGVGISVQNVDGTNRVAIAGYKAATWNAAGTQLIAVRNDNRLVMMDPDGNNAAAPFFDGSAGAGIQSIDLNEAGDKIVLCSGPSGWFRIHTLNPDGTGLTALTPNGQAALDPRWSPDGTKIYYTRRLVGQDLDVRVMNADGTGDTPLANSTSDEQMPVPRASGTVLYLFDDAGTVNIWEMNADGSGKQAFESLGTGITAIEAE